MKSLRLAVLAVAVASAAMLVGCDSPEKMKDMPQEALPKMAPNPMVLRGKTVEGKITGVFPPKYFHKKAELEIIPVVVYEGGELVLPSKTYQGQDATANNPVVNYENGGPYNHPFSFAYKNDMLSSHMELRFKIHYKGEEIPFPHSYKVGVGIDATQLLVDGGFEPVKISDNFTRNRTISKEAEIRFAIQQPTIRSGELTKEDVKAFQAAIKELNADAKASLSRVEISAYASPDGPASLNESLYKGRGKNTQNWMNSTLRRMKQDPGIVSISEEATDWDGFKRMVEASSIEDKDMILRVLSMYSDPAVRNQEMHNLGKVFQTLAEDILPKLRRSKMVATVSIEGKTDEEMKSLVAAGNFDGLTLEEGLFIANQYDDLGDQRNVYKNLMTRFNDIRLFNNMACICIKLNDLAGAKELLEQASAINANNPAVLNNLGVIAAREGNLDEAKRLFGRATDAGQVVRANLGACAIMDGDYSAAIDYLKGIGNFNEGLALLLADRNDAAKTVLNDVRNAKAYYALAIIGARSNDEQMVISNLRNAFNSDSNLKARAKKDVVFAKYAQNELFANLVK